MLGFTISESPESVCSLGLRLSTARKLKGNCKLESPFKIPAYAPSPS